MSGPRPRARGCSSSWSPRARCTSTASGPLPDLLAPPGSTGLPSSSILPLPISLLPPFREPTVSLVGDLLVLGAPLVGTLLMATVLLALLVAHRVLGGFHRLADSLPGEHPHDRIHDDVTHATHLPSPPALGVPDLGASTGHLLSGALSGRLISTSSWRRSPPRLRLPSCGCKTPPLSSGDQKVSAGFAYPLRCLVSSSISTSSRLTSSSTICRSWTTSLRTRISSFTTGFFWTTTSSSTTGTDTSSAPIWASEASPLTGTRSTLTASRRVGTSTRSRSVRTRLRTLTLPTSRSRVPASSSSSLRCTLSSSSSSRSLPGWLRPSWLRSCSRSCSRNSPVSVSPMLIPGPTASVLSESVVPTPLRLPPISRRSVPISQSYTRAPSRGSASA